MVGGLQLENFPAAILIELTMDVALSATSMTPDLVLTMSVLGLTKSFTFASPMFTYSMFARAFDIRE